jgi:hypothetical protein
MASFALMGVLMGVRVLSALCIGSSRAHLIARPCMSLVLSRLLLPQLVASGFVYAMSLALYFRRSIVTSPKRRYIYTAIVSFLIAVVMWTSPYTRLSDRVAVNTLFQSGRYNATTDAGTTLALFYTGSAYTRLLHFFVVKFVTIVFSLTMPMPCGIFLPLLTVAGSIGRAYGDLINSFLPNAYEPGVYAVVACSAMIAGATHTISPCIIILEITSQANNIMPILVCTVIAYSVAGLFTISLYDMMLEINDLPYLPRVKTADVYRLRARDTMHTEFPYLSLQSTGADALTLISSKRSSAEDASTIAQFPLVDSPDRMVLLGAVSRDDLEEFVLRDPRLRQMFRIVRSAPHWTHERTSNVTPATVPRGLSAAGSFTALRSSSSAHFQSAAIDLKVSDDIRRVRSAADLSDIQRISSTATDWGDVSEPDRSFVPASAVGVGVGSGTGISVPRSGSFEGIQLDRNHSSGIIRVKSGASDSSGAGGEAIYRSTSRVLTETRSNWLNELLPFDMTPAPPESSKRRSLKAIPVDLAPFQVSDLTPTALLHYLFAICTYGRMYVTFQGRLVGVLFKGDFLKDKHT